MVAQLCLGCPPSREQPPLARHLLSGGCGTGPHGGPASFHYHLLHFAGLEPGALRVPWLAQGSTIRWWQRREGGPGWLGYESLSLLGRSSAYL